MSSRSRNPSAKRAGRRPGDPELTRQSILESARTQFAATGFATTTIRQIAADADVDPALVLHYFGTKRQLFMDAHDIPFDPTQLVRAASECPVEERGHLIARMQLEAFAKSPVALSMMRGAATDEELAQVLADFLTATLLDHADELIPGDDPTDKRLRVALIGSHLVGVLFTQDICRLQPMRDSDRDRIVSLVGQAIQTYFDAR